MKFKSKRFGIRFCFNGSGNGRSSNNSNGKTQQQDHLRGVCNNISCIKWELTPGGMLVQKRQESAGEDLISIRVSTFSQWHDISIEATSTFGELKMVLSLMTGLEPREQRLLFRGKERDDLEYLHMVGVGDKDKLFLLEDPAIKETKLLGIRGNRDISSHIPHHNCIVING